MEDKEITPEQILELAILTKQLNEHIDILVAENKKLNHNFSKAKKILADIMDFYEMHSVMTKHECREIMKKYMNE